MQTLTIASRENDVRTVEVLDAGRGLDVGETDRIFPTEDLEMDLPEDSMHLCASEAREAQFVAEQMSFSAALTGTAKCQPKRGPGATTGVRAPLFGCMMWLTTGYTDYGRRR